MPACSKKGRKRTRPEVFPDEWEQIMKEYDNGDSFAEIADRHGMNESKLISLFREAGEAPDIPLQEYEAVRFAARFRALNRDRKVSELPPVAQQFYIEKMRCI